MKELGNYDQELIKEIEILDSNIHGSKTLEDSTGNMIDFNEFNLPVTFLSNIF